MPEKQVAILQMTALCRYLNPHTEYVYTVTNQFITMHDLPISAGMQSKRIIYMHISKK